LKIASIEVTIKAQSRMVYIFLGALLLFK